MVSVCVFLLMIFMLYFGLPTIWGRGISPFVVSRLKNKKQIALTFDDGPDPIYTPVLLDILKKNKIKATFFILADKAEKYPEIIQRIVKEGHEPALHWHTHINPWCVFPPADKVETETALVALKVLGVIPEFWRTPWAMYTLSTYIIAYRKKLRLAYWSVRTFDWSRNRSSEDIEKSLLKKVKGGDIIVLHDGGGQDNAPERMCNAIKKVIPVFVREGYEFVTLTKAFGRRGEKK